MDGKVSDDDEDSGANSKFLPGGRPVVGGGTERCVGVNLGGEGFGLFVFRRLFHGGKQE